MLSRPQDFIEGSIARMADLLRKKAYRDGMIDGAEPREKRIEELEITIGTLRTFNNEQATCIERLKQENVELKTDYEVLSCSVGDFGELQDRLEEEQRKNNGLEEQLTKAKELLKTYKDFIEYEGLSTRLGNLYDKTKQFLKESE